MPPQIKHDLNRSGWETTDLPSVCERCLPENPYVQMLKEDHGAECKLCTRPFTVFRWKADRTARQKRTGICLTCARLKNCCQCCMLDLSFGLPITIRDAALKMVAPGPQSEINREFFAQNHEREIEEGRGLEGYDKTDEKARELLRKLAENEPAYKRQRRLALEAEAEREAGGGQKLLEAGSSSNTAGDSGVGPSRTKPRKSAYGSAYGNAPYARPDGANGNRGGNSGRKAFPSAATLPPQPQDIRPPQDRNITSLFVTGVEDDMLEHDIRTHFAQFGALRSIVCSHRSHCAFLNFMTRADAEKAAEACQGRAVVKGVPLRVQWGKPKPLDSMDREQRMKNARAARNMGGAGASATGANAAQLAIEGSSTSAVEPEIPKPPGMDDDVEYAAMTGE